MPRSPFALESWEPRFVVENFRADALRCAIELWTISELRAHPPFTHVMRHADHLLVACSRDRDNGAWEPLPQPLAIDELASWILAWLKTATYPAMPNLDDEAPGFTVFWAHYQCVESGNYGSLVVIPKWIELHK
jgi:hypothetical protein